MARLELKPSQVGCIEMLAKYCAEVRRWSLSKALRPERDAYDVVAERDYYSPDAFAGVPYVCLRVPTGGGKTLIASHAVGTIARHLGHTDRPLCLWVTPTTTIRDQTLRGLRDRNHPYSEALRESIGGNVQVLTIEEAQYASKAMMSSDAIVIVTTIQSYRIDEEGNRKVYQDNGYLMDHFSNLPEWARQVLRSGGQDPDANGGRVSLSLANAMKLRSPIVIMDEAHNARTKISFDSLARFGPLAVLELTATPQREHDPDNGAFASNVLHAVSALQLQTEGLIKLPVELESRSDWLDVLSLTIEKRKELANLAEEFEQETGRVIRPIAVIQAQPKNKARETHTAERVKEKLTDPKGPFKLSASAVRIVTGTVDEIKDDEDLSSKDCPVEYIITVDKLREGWDCPNAYVLGSIGNVATETAVEQLLGRVLRMPGAKKTEIPELDRAYAVVLSEDVTRTAMNLRDSMVERCGFDENSVADALRVMKKGPGQRPLALAAIPLDEKPNLEKLPDSLRVKLDFDEGTKLLRVHGTLDRDQIAAVRDATQTLGDRAAVEAYWERERPVGIAAKPLDEYAEPFLLPQLTVRVGDRVVLFEPVELDEYSWDLDSCDPVVVENEFGSSWEAGSRVLIEMDEQGGAKLGSINRVMVRQLELLDVGVDWSEAELVRWLNAELHKGQRFMGLTAMESLAWIRRVVDHLLRVRGVDLGVIVRKRHALADVLIPRVSEHGRKQVRGVAEELIRGSTRTRLTTSFEHAFELSEQSYAPYSTHTGGPGFHKHAFSKIGSMNGEEEECAKRIDDHPKVKRWIRNPDHVSAGGFSLPLSPGRFYPDFVCELADGRIALVEYKGKQLSDNPQEFHKKAMGEFWEKQSDGRGVFVWVSDRDWGALEAGLNR